MILETHHSPDGVLTFVIEEVDEGVRALGFSQSEWHTHAHFLVPDWGVTEDEAVRAYTDALLRGEAVIGMRRKGGEIVEVWITEDAALESDAFGEGETLELRYWDGRPWTGLPQS